MVTPGTDLTALTDSTDIIITDMVMAHTIRFSTVVVIVCLTHTSVIALLHYIRDRLVMEDSMAIVIMPIITTDLHTTTISLLTQVIAAVRIKVPGEEVL